MTDKVDQSDEILSEIAEVRFHQLEIGHTREKDDLAKSGQLIFLARKYLTGEKGFGSCPRMGLYLPNRDSLLKAIALLTAEIERQDRLEAAVEKN
jgi:hypothetical protein